MPENFSTSSMLLSSQVWKRSLYVWREYSPVNSSVLQQMHVRKVHLHSFKTLLTFHTFILQTHWLNNAMFHKIAYTNIYKQKYPQCTILHPSKPCAAQRKKKKTGTEKKHVAFVATELLFC